jgi:LPXTG-motif cell wall-anchored protein
MVPMKKRMMIMLCSAMLICGLSVPTMAAVSPTGKRDVTTTTNKATTAPKTGEGNLALYSLAGALLLGGTAVISRKKLEQSR